MAKLIIFDLDNTLCPLGKGPSDTTLSLLIALKKRIIYVLHPMIKD